MQQVLRADLRVTFAEQLQERSSPQKRPDSAPPFRKESQRSQLEESRKLNSEGLEVILIPLRLLAD